MYKMVFTKTMKKITGNILKFQLFWLKILLICVRKHQIFSELDQKQILIFFQKSFLAADSTTVIRDDLLFICLYAYLNNRVISDIRRLGNCQNQVLERIFAYSNSDCRIRIPEYSGTISIALLSQFFTMLRRVLHKKY